ncbi:MAG: ABC transporter permease, partial [Halobaculum sp.]
MSTAEGARERLAGLDRRGAVGVATLLAGAVATVYGLAFPETTVGRLVGILFERSTLTSALRLSVPIAFAALGGIFSEKSGVINIGLEGLLIVSAFTGFLVADVTGSFWLGIVGGVVGATLLAGVFAVVCLEFRADQIIAGLAVWLIALGLAPFASSVVYGGTNSDTNSAVAIPSLQQQFGFLPTAASIPPAAELPILGA